MKPHFIGILALGLIAWAGRAGAADFDVGSAANGVGLGLFRGLRDGAQAGNLALSPYSVESAMALAYTGADGETRAEMARVLGLSGDDQQIQGAFASIRDSMDRIAAESVENEARLEKSGGHGDVIEWHSANRLYGQQGYGFRDSFLKSLDSGYGAPFEEADFRGHADQERLKINGWVEDQTRTRIRDLIPQGGVSAATRMVLVNALYLKAPWQHPFSERETSSLPFYPSGGQPEAVPTMRETAYMGYVKGAGYTAVTLPYLGSGLQLLILLPDDRDGLGRLVADITPALLRDCCSIAHSSDVTLYLPRFQVGGPTVPLKQCLEALGMRAAFDEPPGSADFDRAAPRRPGDYLMISDVFHKAFVAVDEHGTEAAAATAVAMVAGAAMTRPVVVRVDHPFFFAIQHRASGACLFLGSIGNPG